MNGMRAILFLGLCCAPALLSAKTRQEVISDAAAYASYSWTVERKNLKDVLRCEQGLMIPDSEGDGLDDRGQVGSTETATCAYYPSLWPFVVGSTVTGEAYAYGYWDTTGTFKTRLGLEDPSWIAAKRSEDSLPPNYAGFTGLDCSGYISRLLGLGRHYSTLELPEYGLKISTSVLKRGDFLDRYVIGADGNPEGRHAMVVKDVHPSSVTVYHATPNSFATGTHERRVIEETIKMWGADKLVYLWDARWSNKYYYYPYSPFPQFAWVRPSKDAP
ncbi:MAG TPA: hypothetical protein PKL83_07110, partial [bacterium]|nr:hypothetical protein [bacterium]